MVGTVAMNN